MDEVPRPVIPRKRYELIFAVILIIICVIAAVDIAYPYIFSGNNVENRFTTNYTNVTAEAAYNLINTTANLTIIDCRGLEGCSQCQFNKGHLPHAQMNMNALTLYNSTNDTLVYSKDGTVGAQFCQELMNHVYCKVYNLIGGYVAWEAAGYPKG